MTRNWIVAMSAGAILTFAGIWVGLNRPWLSGISILPGFLLLSGGAWLAVQGLPRDEVTGQIPPWWRSGLLTVLLVALFTAVAFWVSFAAVVSANN